MSRIFFFFLELYRLELVENFRKYFWKPVSKLNFCKRKFTYQNLMTFSMIFLFPLLSYLFNFFFQIFFIFILFWHYSLFTRNHILKKKRIESTKEEKFWQIFCKCTYVKSLHNPFPSLQVLICKVTCGFWDFLFLWFSD